MIRGGARLALAALLLAGGVAAAQAPFTLERSGQGIVAARGHPSEVVAAEIAFAKLAREEGQWTSFRKTADRDGVLFVPGVVNAQAWLRKRADPARTVIWAPLRVLMSCDGSYGVAHGHAEYPDGRKTGYVTIWRRQQNGSYKWVLDWSTTLPAESAEDGVDGKVADCARRREPDPTAAPPTDKELREWRKRQQFDVVRIPDPPPATGEGQSRDGTLSWRWQTGPDGARALKVTGRYGGETLTFIDDSFPAEPS